MKIFKIEHPNQWWHWLILSLIGLFIIFIPLPVTAQPPVERIIHIDAQRFEYNPAIIRVNPNDKVTIVMTAQDVVHGLSIDGYNLEMIGDPGASAQMTFVADQQGTFRFRCTSTCGNMHPFMIGKLQVGENTTLWRALTLAGLVLVVGAWKGNR